MSRRNVARLQDIVDAVKAIHGHLTRGDLNDGLVYDADRVRLIEIGEAVKGIDPHLLDKAVGVPWREIARMRDHLAHHYFDTDHAIVQDVVENDLGPLLGAVRSMLEQAEPEGGPAWSRRPGQAGVGTPRGVIGPDPAARAGPGAASAPPAPEPRPGTASS